MENEKKRRSVTAALMWRITALALGLWLCMMCCITWACAWDVCHQYEYWFAQDVRHIERDMERFADPERGYDKADIQYDVINMSIWLRADDAFPFMDIYDRYEYAIVCFDKRTEDGFDWATPCFVEDENLMYFWIFEYGYVYIDLDETQFGRDIVAESTLQHDDWVDYYPLSYRFDRLTGWFEGNRFHLVEVVDYPDDWDLSREPEEEWITVVNTAEPGQELVYLYPETVNIRRGSTKPVTVDGVTYENLGDMLENGVYYNTSENSIFKAVFQSHVYFTDASGGEYLIRMAAQASPLKAAFLGLRTFYVVTLMILAVVLLLIYRGIHKRLVAPMKRLLKLVAEDSLYMPEPEEYWWNEPYELYVQPRNAIHELKKEINQLNAALEYAKNAEDNRKRMISNITHELKTPLAVIHSYAEGLQEGIAGDNQDHYLDVILEEADQMDGMVLEMLDLSRLEAGKVRLASDRFSLPELTKRVFEKLKPLMQEKELEVEYLWSQDYQITADEGRMTQVVTNLATNAIKYSPEGGRIVVQIYWYDGYFRFTIENQSDPIPEENLAKLWDSFYRTDASRTEKGTGLGLTITKTIVELHGGVCAARNTPNGVQFEFALP